MFGASLITWTFRARFLRASVYCDAKKEEFWQFKYYSRLWSLELLSVTHDLRWLPKSFTVAELILWEDICIIPTLQGLEHNIERKNRTFLAWGRCAEPCFEICWDVPSGKIYSLPSKDDVPSKIPDLSPLNYWIRSDLTGANSKQIRCLKEANNENGAVFQKSLVEDCVDSCPLPVRRAKNFADEYIER